MSRENRGREDNHRETERENRAAKLVVHSLINLPFYCQSSIQKKQKNKSITKVKRKDKSFTKNLSSARIIRVSGVILV